MSSSVFAIIEISLVFGLVLAWGGWQLWSLRRERQRDEAKARALQSAPVDSADSAANAPVRSPEK